MDMPDDGAPRRIVEADGRLVEEEQLRAVQQGRAISTRRRWPPFSARTRSPMRSAMSSAFQRRHHALVGIACASIP